MKNEFEEHRYFMEISRLTPISKGEIEKFKMQLDYMWDYLLFNLLTTKND